MATPLTVSVPPLSANQKIADWEPKFRASVVSLQQGSAIRLLPAYVNRGKMEERVVLAAIQKETLDDAFKLLKERLDPPTDRFPATSKFRQMVWLVGELVYDFFSRYLEEGLRAGLSTKQIYLFCDHTNHTKQIYLFYDHTTSMRGKPASQILDQFQGSRLHRRGRHAVRGQD